MPSEKLTDRTIKSDKFVNKARQNESGMYDAMDELLTGFGLRVAASGLKTFILVTRFPRNPRHPTRRSLGRYGTITLEEARTKARRWIELIRQGKDPQEEAERLRLAEQTNRENTFGAVADDYIKRAVIGSNPERPLQRKGPVVKRELEREFVEPWRGRPIAEIKPHDVMKVLDAAVDRGSPYQAHNLLGHVRRMFNWAIARGVYGIDRSPCDRMKPKDVIGRKALRTRVLNDEELRTYWGAAGNTPYPYGPLFKILALTGQRKSEVAEARWSEFKLKQKLWTIPAERMKADAPHVVPLSHDVVTLLEDLPTWKDGGDFLFSTTEGQKPVNGFSKAKELLDKEISKLGKVEPFVLHDIRRTMRTGLSALPVTDLVRELVIAHRKPGLHRVYDQFEYLAEKRTALDLWAARLRDVVTQPPENVVRIARRRNKSA